MVDKPWQPCAGKPSVKTLRMGTYENQTCYMHKFLDLMLLIATNDEGDVDAQRCVRMADAWALTNI